MHRQRQDASLDEPHVHRRHRGDGEGHGGPCEKAIALELVRQGGELLHGMQQRRHDGSGPHERQHAAPHQRTQHRLWQEPKKHTTAADEEGDDHGARDAMRQPCLGPRGFAERGPADDARHRHSAHRCARKVGHPLRDELLVAVPHLPVLVRPPIAHRRALQVRGDADGNSGDDQRPGHLLGERQGRGGGKVPQVQRDGAHGGAGVEAHEDCGAADQAAQ
mmetsp:Transcript_24997/g.62427  ORF Transcript_24997/g.62427 Transcript_24997/m.62427 type:complete len:220 (+) Transcript_24997:482-1141(+)